jgi:hypothetical protein
LKKLATRSPRTAGVVAAVSVKMRLFASAGFSYGSNARPNAVRRSAGKGTDGPLRSDDHIGFDPR